MPSSCAGTRTERSEASSTAAGTAETESAGWTKDEATRSCVPTNGWTYDLDGNLIGVPEYDERYFGDLDKNKWGLVPIAQVDTYKGLIFGTFDSQAPPLLDYLGDIRWALDVTLDRREGGTELVGGVCKWTMNCNWKFCAENFIGDNYHGITHKSAMIVGHQTGGSRTGYSTPSRDFGIVDQGHGANLSVLPEDENWFDNLEEPLRSYHHATADEAEERLGAMRARQIPRYNCNVFPNLSVSGSSRMLHLWQPRDPLHTEVWLYTLVDKDAPPEVKDQLRLDSQRHFGPSGMFEQDDAENWEQSTLAGLGFVARQYPLNYQQAIGHEEFLQDGGLPHRIVGHRHEYNARMFHRRWVDLMSAENWADLRD